MHNLIIFTAIGFTDGFFIDKIEVNSINGSYRNYILYKTANILIDLVGK